MNTNTRVRVSKRFSFDMAHALYGYDGPCKNIHGHTYHLTVTLIGAPEPMKQDVKLGMVIDFGDVKECIQRIILSRFDHALVLNEEAPYSRSAIISSEFEKVILVPYQPTCENLLLDFVELVKPSFNGAARLVAMRLEETPSSWAEWQEADNEK